MVGASMGFENIQESIEFIRQMNKNIVSTCPYLWKLRAVLLSYFHYHLMAVIILPRELKTILISLVLYFPREVMITSLGR